MLKYGMKPIAINKDYMRLVHKPETVKWDMKMRKCSYQWWDQTISPKIIHYKTDETYTYQYEHYNVLVSGKYGIANQLSIFLRLAYVFTKYKIYPRI